VLLRFMGIRSEGELGRSRRVAIVWCLISMVAAICIGIVGRSVPGIDYLTNAQAENIFIDTATAFLPPILAGLACAGILAASISSSDSYLLISASALSKNIYQGLLKKNATEKQVMWCSRITLVGITVIAMVIAWNQNSTIFSITSFAWAGFGAAFGPLMLFSLFWKRTTYPGAIAGMLSGGAMVFFWKLVINPLGGVWGIYCLLPAFIVSSLVIVAVSLCTQVDKSIETEFDDVLAGQV
jgi:Na+/proline symporter